jgi:hypothetical protein
MLSNDIGKRLMIRFKKSKDFNKTILKLQQEGYKTFQCGYIAEDKKNYNQIIVGKNNNVLCKVIYEENEDTTSEYKQSILEILY